MVPADGSAVELDRLRGRWLERLDESLASGTFSPEELTELARRYRTLAETAESRGQRRAALSAAERFEHAARGRVAANP